MDASGWIISGIGIAIALLLALGWDRNARRRGGRDVIDTRRAEPAVGEPRRAEFLSEPWIAMAREEIVQALSRADRSDLDERGGTPFTLSEEFTNPPAHLRSGADTIGFSVRVGPGRVEVLGRPDSAADCRVVSDYRDALAIARDPDAAALDPAEVERRIAAGRLRIIGDPSRMPLALQRLDVHRLLAARTA